MFKLNCNHQMAKLNGPNFVLKKPFHYIHNLHSVDNSCFYKLPGVLFGVAMFQTLSHWHHIFCLSLPSESCICAWNSLSPAPGWHTACTKMKQLCPHCIFVPLTPAWEQFSSENLWILKASQPALPHFSYGWLSRSFSLSRFREYS